MNYILILSGVSLFIGFLGALLPAMPGPLFSFLGIVLLYFGKPDAVSLGPVFAFGLGMLILFLLDYLGPVIGAKYLGASKRGVLGSIIGGLAGLIFYPPLGIFLGALLGAYLAEINAGKKSREAIKSAMGVLAGSVFVLVLQAVYSLAAAVYFIFKVI